MHVLILSSRCTEEQRNALTVLRGCLEAHGDVCEALDWFSFLADSVSQINAHSRKLVRRHVQELLTEGFSARQKLLKRAAFTSWSIYARRSLLASSGMGNMN